MLIALLMCWLAPVSFPSLNTSPAPAMTDVAMEGVEAVSASGDNSVPCTQDDNELEEGMVYVGTPASFTMLVMELRAHRRPWMRDYRLVMDLRPPIV